MELKKKDWLIIYTLVGLVFVFLILKVIVQPFHDKLSGVNKQVLLQEARLKKGIGLLENKAAIDNEYGKYASYFSLQDFSNEEIVASFLREIERISRESGFLILDIKPQKDPTSDKISKQFEISIKAEADLRQLTTFLHNLYNSNLLFSVEKMILVPKENSPNLNVSLTVAGVSFL